MTKTRVEHIFNSFKRQFHEFTPEWFQLLVERPSTLLGVVTVEEADILYTRYGISSENDDDDMVIYRVGDLEKFKSAANA